MSTKVCAPSQRTSFPALLAVLCLDRERDRSGRRICESKGLVTANRVGERRLGRNALGGGSSRQFNA